MKKFIKYASNHSFDHLHISITMKSHLYGIPDSIKAIFDNLNVKELIVKEDRGNIFPPQVYEDIK